MRDSFVNGLIYITNDCLQNRDAYNLMKIVRIIQSNPEILNSSDPKIKAYFNEVIELSEYFTEADIFSEEAPSKEEREEEKETSVIELPDFNDPGTYEKLIPGTSVKRINIE